MALEDYRRVTISSDYANEPIDPIRLSAGDDNGRILRFVLKNGENNVSTTGLTCRFLIDQGAGLYQTLTPVTGTTTATWEAPLPMGGVTAGQHVGTIEVTDSSDNVVCCRNFSIIVEMGIFANGEQSESMQDALSEFQEKTNAAVQQNLDAVEDAETAAQAANTAAGLANNAYNSAQQAITELARYVPISAGNILVGSVGGTSVDTADDAYTGPVQGFTLYGKSVQDGTPTPSAPVEIKSVAECDVVTAGRNLLLEASHNTTGSGITWTAQEDGSIVASGTTNSSQYQIRFSPTLTGNYTASGCPSGGSISSYDLYVWDQTNNRRARDWNGNTSTSDTGNGSRVHLESGVEYIMALRVQSGSTASSLTFKPQLQLGATIYDYETPHVEETPLIPSTVEPLRSLPDGTHDVLKVMRDGSGVITRNVTSRTFSSSDIFGGNVENGYYFLSQSGLQAQNATGIICDRLTSVSTNVSVSAMPNYSIKANANTWYVRNTVVQSLADFKTFIDGTTVVYKLATPTTETIPATAMPSLLSRYLTAWADASDQNGDALAGVEWEMEYERSLQVVIDNIEQAIADI